MEELRFADIPIWGAYEVRSVQSGKTLFSHALNEPGDYPQEMATWIVAGVYADGDRLVVEVGV